MILFSSDGGRSVQLSGVLAGQSPGVTRRSQPTTFRRPEELFARRVVLADRLDSNGVAMGVATFERSPRSQSSLGPIPQNAIPTPGRFLELKHQRANSLQFLERNQSNPIVGPIPKNVIPIPGRFHPKTAKEPAL